MAHPEGKAANHQAAPDYTATAGMPDDGIADPEAVGGAVGAPKPGPHSSGMGLVCEAMTETVRGTG